MDHRNGARGSERPNELRALAWPDLLPWRMKLALSAAKRRRAALVAGLLFALAPFPVAWGYMQGAERLAEQKERLTRQLGPVRAAAMAQRALTSRLENGRKVLAAWARLEGQAASWPLFLDGLETAAAGGAWLERLLPVPAPAPRNAKAPAGPRQIALAGYLRAAPADDPAAPAEARERMRRLTAAFARLPEVASVGQERFDRGTGPELRFECVLTLKADSFL